MSAGPLRYGLLTDQESDFAQSCQRALAKDSARANDSEGVAAGGKDGWFGVGIAEEHGGAGGSMADVAVMAEEIGAAHAASLAAWQDGLLLAVRNPDHRDRREHVTGRPDDGIRPVLFDGSRQ